MTSRPGRQVVPVAPIVQAVETAPEGKRFEPSADLAARNAFPRPFSGNDEGDRHADAGVPESGEDQPPPRGSSTTASTAEMSALESISGRSSIRRAKPTARNMGETDGRAAVAGPRSHEVTREYPQRHPERQLDRARKPSRGTGDRSGCRARRRAWNAGTATMAERCRCAGPGRPPRTAPAHPLVRTSERAAADPASRADQQCHAMPHRVVETLAASVLVRSGPMRWAFGQAASRTAAGRRSASPAGSR